MSNDNEEIKIDAKISLKAMPSYLKNSSTRIYLFFALAFIYAMNLNPFLYFVCLSIYIFLAIKEGLISHENSQNIKSVLLEKIIEQMELANIRVDKEDSELELIGFRTKIGRYHDADLYEEALFSDNFVYIFAGNYDLRKTKTINLAEDEIMLENGLVYKKGRGLEENESRDSFRLETEDRQNDS